MLLSRSILYYYIFPRKIRPLTAFDFGNRAMKVFLNVYDISFFSMPIKDIYMFIKGHLSQHQERSCKADLSITFIIP